MREYWALAKRAVAAGDRFPVEDGQAIVRWAPGGGPEIWAQIDRSGDVVAATPFFATDDVYRIAVTGSGSSDDGALEGWVDGWLNPREPDEPYSGLFPLRVDVVNYPLVRQRLIPGTLISIRLASILHEATLYPDAAAYDAVKEVTYRPPVQSFASTIHFGVDDPTDDDAEAMALVTGYVTEARQIANSSTGVPFWWLRVATDGVTLSCTADEDVVPVQPRAAMVVSASGWVLGEVLPEALP
jgi:hypothetical protein